jgi:UDP-N-acetylglucosamine 2-epimerase (non-hydrolysing)
MSDAILQDLQVPPPDFHLGVGSGSHAEQTGNVMIAYEKVCQENRPDWIVVVGDVNSTAACAMVGTKLWIPVIHLEAGLRSGDRRMPEEINRLVTDAIADVLWTPSLDANENLIREGVNPEKIDLIGNIMIDSFEMLRSKIEESNSRGELGIDGTNYALVTLHRPSNVDSEDTLRPIISELTKIATQVPLVFVAHPRTIKSLDNFGWRSDFEAAKGVILLEPMSYIRFMNVVIGAQMVITDSGGLQEETTYLDIPCLTLRENTERPITISQGTNRLVNATNLSQNVDIILAGSWHKGQRPPHWDGKTAERAVETLKSRL